MTNLMLEYPNVTVFVFSIVFFVVGIFIEKLRIRKDKTSTKIDNYIVDTYDYLVKSLADEKFKRVVTNIAKLIEVKFIREEIKADERYEKLKEILQEKINNKEIEAPKEWEQLVKYIVEEFCIEEKYEREKSKAD